jgi:hypothetical protein
MMIISWLGCSGFHGSELSILAPLSLLKLNCLNIAIEKNYCLLRRLRDSRVDKEKFVL